MRSFLAIETICKVHEISLYKHSPLNNPILNTRESERKIDTNRTIQLKVEQNTAMQEALPSNPSNSHSYTSLTCWDDVKEIMNWKQTPNTVHFVFFDVGAGDTIETSKHSVLYKKNMLIFQRLHPDWRVVLWNHAAATALISNFEKQLLTMWNMLGEQESGFYQVDFARYVILKKCGGVYVDLDIEMKQRLIPEKQYIFASTKPGGGTRKITNSIICLNDKSLYDELLQFVISRFFTVQIPTQFDRHLLYTVGALGYAAFCKLKELNETHTEASGLCIDFGTCSWVALNRSLPA